jgi:hypothetical protein
MGAGSERPGAAHGRVARRAFYVVVACLAAAQAGCLIVAAGVAGGAAATGYCYYKGRYYRDYPTAIGDALAAVRTALLELQFPVLSEEAKNGTAFVSSKTADGSAIRIYLDTVDSRVPADGPALTRVAVRVGAFGDEEVSRRILDQVTRHLVAPAILMPTAQPTAGAPPAPSPVRPASAALMPGETPPPPLAPPAPKGK